MKGTVLTTTAGMRLKPKMGMLEWGAWRICTDVRKEVRIMGGRFINRKFWGATLVVVAFLGLGMSLKLAAAQAEPPEVGTPEGLETLVSIQVKRMPLGTFLRKLSEDAGVSLKAEGTLQDLKVTAFLSRLPLRTVQRALAELFDGQWERVGEEEGKLSYRFLPVQDRKNKRERAWRIYTTLLAQQLDELVRQCGKGQVPTWMLEDLSSEERLQWGSQMQGRASIVGNLPPSLLTAVLQGKPVLVPVQSLQGSLGKAVRDFARKFAMPVSAGWEPKQVEAAEIEFSSNVYWPAVNPDLPLRDISFSFILGGAPISTYNVIIHPHRFDQNLTQALAREGVIRQWFPNQVKRENRERELDEPLAISNEPLGGKEVILADVLEKLAIVARINVIADYHTKPPRALEIWKGSSLGYALNAIATTFNELWTNIDNCYLFRSKYWWLDDDAEVPESRVQMWKEKLQAQGHLDLEDFVEIARFNDVAIGRLGLVLPEAKIVQMHLPLLRFYDGLTEEQKAKAGSKAGLNLDEVNPQLKSLLKGYQRMIGVVRASKASVLLAHFATLKGGVLRVSKDVSVHVPKAVFSFSAQGHDRVDMVVPLGFGRIGTQ